MRRVCTCRKSVLILVGMVAWSILAPWKLQAQEGRYGSSNYPGWVRTVGLALGPGVTVLESSSPYYFRLGEKLSLGVGPRLSYIWLKDQELTSADAKQITGKGYPANTFAERIPSQVDTLGTTSTRISALNLMLGLDYQLSRRIAVGVNIDLIGYSFGPTRNGVLRGPNVAGALATDYSPEGFNLLLGNNADRGTLNSQLYLRYYPWEVVGVQVSASHLFSEARTEARPTGKTDRYRLVSTLISFSLVIYTGRR